MGIGIGVAVRARWNAVRGEEGGPSYPRGEGQDTMTQLILTAHSHLPAFRDTALQRGMGTCPQLCPAFLEDALPCVCLSVCSLVLEEGRDGAAPSTSPATSTGETNPSVRRGEGVYQSPLRHMRGGFITDFPFSHALFSSSLSCQLELASSHSTLYHSQIPAGATRSKMPT